MGIQNLKKLISTHSNYEEHPLSKYTGKKFAIDASTALYQFLIAIRADGVKLGLGETSSHIVGFFYRTIKYIENGIKIIYVFDGKPPQLKSYELDKRSDRRMEAEISYEEAVLRGDKLEMEKFDKRKLKVEKKDVDAVKKLLDLMMVPYVDAPSEAEAYCAFLCKKGIVDYVVSEDMDTLTFGSPTLLTNLSTSDSKKLIKEFNLKRILKDLEINMDQFIDLCIILGCDYTKSIKGIGPQKGIQLIKKHKNIENILKNEKIKEIEDFNFKGARDLFKELSELKENENNINLDINWDKINEKEIHNFLVNEYKFNEDRVKKGMERMFKGRKKSGQMNLNTWFTKK